MNKSDKNPTYPTFTSYSGFHFKSIIIKCKWNQKGTQSIYNSIQLISFSLQVKFKRENITSLKRSNMKYNRPQGSLESIT